MRFRFWIALFIVALGIGVLSAWGQKPVDAEARRLLRRLEAVERSGRVAFGHMDDLSFGRYWKHDADSSDVLSATGDYPAIVGWDFIGIEEGTGHTSYWVWFDEMRQKVAAHHGRGGVNTVSWHCANPATHGSSKDLADGMTLRRVFANQALTDTLVKWIGLAADMIGSFRDAGGNRIPVLFRPWHEHTGGWFWWGKNQCTKDEYVRLWRLTREVFDRKGVDNVLWVYSPDTIEDYADYIERYPGDAYVDVMGCDLYYCTEPEADSKFNDRLALRLGSAVRAACEHGKIAALTETGYIALPDANWFTRSLLPQLKKYKIAYALVWHNCYESDKMFCTPYPGHPGTADFRKFAKNKRVLFLKDFKKFK